MKRLAAIAFVAPLLLAQAPAGQQRTVKAVRHWSLPEATRVAIEVSGEFSYRSDRLHNPERVYFDILESRPYIAERRYYSETLEDRMVQKIRVAETNPGVTRIVLDLGDSVEVAASQLTNPSRLIVELRKSQTDRTESKSPEIPVPTADAPAPALSVPPPRPAEVPKPVATATASAAANVIAEPSKAQIAPRETRKTAPAEKPRQTRTETAPPAPPLPAQARRTTSGGSSLIRALGLKIGKVVIDAGHGGHDQGTQGPRGLLEKDLVLDVAKRVGRMVEERMGAEVIYTRSDDTYIPLKARTDIANESKADLFLSIHANSSPASKVAGIETFYLNFTGTQDAMDVAARENAGSDLSVHELSDLVQKIAKHDKSEESREFAQRIQTSLYAFSARNISGSKDRGVKSAPFVVLIGANMPSVLAEIGFLSNPREENLLRKPEYREKLADALYRGLSRYADSLSHFLVTRQAATKPVSEPAGGGTQQPAPEER